MNGFYQRLRQLHFYLGIIVALLLWLVVFAGSLSFYRAELDSWQLSAQVDLPTALPTTAQSTAVALTHLQQVAPKAQHWYIELPHQSSPYLKLHWQQAGERPQLYQQFVNPVTGEALQDPLQLRFGATEHQLGGWFFQLHYNLLQLAGSQSRTVVAAVALLWLLLSLSGLLNLKGHWRSLFKPRQQLSGQSQKLQRHHQLALLTLPFALLFAATGWLTQMFSENSAPQQVLYPQNPYQFYSELFPTPQPAVKAAGAPAALPDLNPMLSAATDAFDGAAVGKISISAPGTINSTVLLSSSAHSRVGNQPQPHTLLFQPQTTTGSKAEAASPLLWQKAKTAATTQAQPLAHLRQLAYGLHQSLYANAVLRLLLFVFGLLSCWMIWLGLKAALRRLKPGLWQQRFSLLVSALPGSFVLASVLLIGQNGLLQLPWSLHQLFLGYWLSSFLVLLAWWKVRSQPH